MSKYRFILLYVILGSMCISCNNWLDVRPETEQKEKDQFSSYRGFCAALTGCYMAMGHEDAYGQKLTMSHIESLASLWYIEGNSSGEQSADYYLQTHDYEKDAARKAIQPIYSKLFNIIVQANKIIANAEANGDAFPDEATRSVILGEAYAIRAYCQLDVLRLFGEVPNGKGEKVSLPYSEVTAFNERAVRYDFASYGEKLLADLEKAESLLKDNDPVFSYTFEDLNNPANVDLEDQYMGYRQSRLNYWAVKALQARLYRYLGQADKAHDIAIEVIKATTTNGKPVVELSSMENYGGTGKSFASPSECLFSLYFDNLHDISVPLLRGGEVRGENATQVQPGNDFCMTPAWIRDLFSTTNTGTDIRSLKMWSETQTSQGEVFPTIRKYFVEKGAGIVPIIRLSEIYLIALEGAKDVAEANSLYETYMVSKGVALHDPFARLDEVPAELEKEYRRELYAEGQMFYFYKRHNASSMWTGGTTVVGESDYILPLPNTELNPNK